MNGFEALDRMAGRAKCFLLSLRGRADIKPEKIKVNISLVNGDTLKAIAFRKGESGGLTQYEVALSDGSPLNLSSETVLGFEMELLPARSEVTLLLGEQE